MPAGAAGEAVAPGTPLRAGDGSRAGQITSSLELPGGEGWIGLALVRRAFLQEEVLEAGEPRGRSFASRYRWRFSPRPWGPAAGRRPDPTASGPPSRWPGCRPGCSGRSDAAGGSARLLGRRDARPDSFPPLPPPEQATGPVHPFLAPVEAQPARHGLEPVAVDRQQPVASQPLMHIHQPGTQADPVPSRGPLAFRQSQQGDRLGFAVVEHGPAGIAKASSSLRSRHHSRRSPCSWRASTGW